MSEKHGPYKTRVRPDYRVLSGAGVSEPKVQLSWQIPAVGNNYVSREDAMQFAEYLRANSDDEWLSFIMLGEDPAEVADDIETAFEKGDKQAESIRIRTEELREELGIGPDE